jgi:hypothetical protein
MTKISRSLRIFLWSYVFIYVVFISLQITQVDIWWQLPEGFHILRTFTLPTQPVAAYGLPAHPYFDEYAGYEVILALFYKLGGFFILWLLFSFTFLAIIFLPLATSGRKYPSFGFVSVLVLLLVGLLMKQRFEERPEMVGSLLQVVLMVLLGRSRLEAVTLRTLFGLVLIFFIWTNTHSSFAIGLFTLGLWIGCELALKFRSVPAASLLWRGLGMGGAAVVACLANPSAATRLLFPWGQARAAGGTALSPEMWPIVYGGAASIIMVLATAALLIGLIVRCRRIPLWLILFSAFSLYLSTRGLRFMNLLAISLLFVHATGDEDVQATGRKMSLPFTMLGDFLFFFLSLFMLLGDSFTLLVTYNTLSHEKLFATHASHFVLEIADVRIPGATGPVPVLCDHGEGSYLSFAEDKNYRPLLDSGLSHFSDETKRYFFLLSHEPEAMELALEHLKVDDILLNSREFSWMLILERLPDWRFVTCTEGGQLWRRCAPGANTLSASAAAQIEESKNQLLRHGDMFGTFCYSTLVDRPAESLDILSRYDGPEWQDADFNYAEAWMAAQTQESVEAFLAADHTHGYPLIDAMLSSRLGPEVYTRFMATNPAGPKPSFWKILQVENALAAGDRPRAAQIFETIPRHPPSSAAYYTLGDEMQNEKTDAFGQWQTWDEDAKKQFEATTERLNDRILHLGAVPPD